MSSYRSGQKKGHGGGVGGKRTGGTQLPSVRRKCGARRGGERKERETRKTDTRDGGRTQPASLTHAAPRHPLHHTPQDYAAHGVTDAFDKQRLYRLIKGMQAQAAAAARAREREEAAPGGGGGGGPPVPAPAPPPRQPRRPTAPGATAAPAYRPTTRAAPPAYDSGGGAAPPIEVRGREKQVCERVEGRGAFPPSPPHPPPHSSLYLFSRHALITQTPSWDGAAAAARSTTRSAATVASAATAAAAAAAAAVAAAGASSTFSAAAAVAAAEVEAADAAAAAAAAQAPPPTLPPIDPAARIRVLVRKRPLNAREARRGEGDAVAVDPATGGLVLAAPRVRVDMTPFTERHAFTFDGALCERAGEDEVYAAAVAPLVAGLLTPGARATVFAYGQTGSGKTHTMAPLPPRAAADVLSAIDAHNGASPRPTRRLALRVAVYEIYGGRLFDLLAGRAPLAAREDGRGRVVVAGLTERAAATPAAVAAACEAAAAVRSCGRTGANADSSRSHCVTQFSVCVEEEGGAGGGALGALGGGGAIRPGRPRPLLQPSSTAAPAPAPPPDPVGRLSFIDLAGSERGADTATADRPTRLEGAQINRSLLALKECIRALDAAARHVPFRGSKLTEVLRDSFVGPGARTVMLAAVSPGSGSCEHTLNTLRYADRVKELRGGGGGGGRGGALAAAPPSSTSSSRRASTSAGPALPAPLRRRATLGGPAAAVAAAAAAAAGEAGTRSADGGGGGRALRPTAATRRPAAIAVAAHPLPPSPADAAAWLAAEEGALVAAGRSALEAGMAGLRAEVVALAAVDAPGAPVGPYAAALEGALEGRRAGLAALEARLGAWKAAQAAVEGEG